MFGWNYPPGVTGNEYAIAGPDYEKEIDELCPKCKGNMIQQGYRDSHWVCCSNCSYQRDIDLPNQKEE